MAQVTQPANDRGSNSSPGRLASEVPDHGLPLFSKQVPHVISAAHRHRYKSMGWEPDETWLSHTGSWGAEGQTALIDFSAGSLNVSVCMTTSDLGRRKKNAEGKGVLLCGMRRRQSRKSHSLWAGWASRGRGEGPLSAVGDEMWAGAGGGVGGEVCHDLELLGSHLWHDTNPGELGLNLI